LGRDGGSALGSKGPPQDEGRLAPNLGLRDRLEQPTTTEEGGADEGERGQARGDSIWAQGFQ
jgi:hypothetical protein